MVILTLNCGSSSVKYQVYDWTKKDVLGKGVLERVGQEKSDLEHESVGKPEYKGQRSCPTHKEAVAWVMELLLDKAHGCLNDMNEVMAVGHRIVHGGAVFTQSVKITADVIEQFKKTEALAPLHNPANLLGIHAAMAVLPNVPHCAILDTAWHQTMPEVAYTYALPHQWKDQFNVRRYGFHGTSFLYTSKRASVLLGKSASQCNLIICHIGNGASICAVKNGVAIDTSMGMTPLEGLVMGTRAGDMDPAIVGYMSRMTGKGVAEIDSALNKESGLQGVTGQFSDRRDVESGMKNGDARCTLAHHLETYRLRKYIGSYVGALGVLPDAVIFTAGVGEFDATVRLHTMEGLECMGIKIDPAKNALARTRNTESCISADESKVKIFVIPTDEELVMTEDTYALVNGTYDVHTKYQYSFGEAGYVNKAREASLPKDLQRLPGLEKIIARSQG
ncbi:MAG: acetate kinase [Spirochaetia bacterium]